MSGLSVTRSRVFRQTSVINDQLRLPIHTYGPGGRVTAKPDDRVRPRVSVLATQDPSIQDATTRAARRASDGDAASRAWAKSRPAGQAVAKRPAQSVRTATADSAEQLARAAQPTAGAAERTSAV